jgi:hypothetical protein
MRPGLVVFAFVGLCGLGHAGLAGTVVGKLELPPPPERPPVVAKGFLDRVENPLAEVRKVNLAPYLVVALEPATPRDRPEAAPSQITWDLVGESFARPVIGVPVGAEVVIRNVTSSARTLAAAEDAQLLVGPLNPTGTKSFRAKEPAVYTIADKEAPHLRGRIVVVATRHVAAVDDAGRFELADVPEGSYKLRVFFADPGARVGAWLPVAQDVVVGAKAKAARPEVTVKLPALGAGAGRK